MRFASRLPELLFPALLVGATALLGSVAAQSNEIHFRTALVDVAIVVGLYVFIGNSGVLSFGQISFVAVGAFLAGELTISTAVKRGIFTIRQDLIIRKVGSISSSDAHALENSLRAWLEL